MVKKNAEKDAGFVQQFNELKKKHPDAVLLFRKGDFYEMYKEDALKASVILALKVSDKILPLENDPIKLLTFPRHELALGVLPLFFCFNVGIVYICSKSIVYEKETTYYQE